jgi:DNA-binding MarR family transcriptional regulator
MVSDATSGPPTGGPPTASGRVRALLSDPELHAWRALLLLHARASRVLEAELMDAHELPLSWYDVLVQLVEADGHRLRMGDLADAVLLSRSGLTRLCDRMVEAGLVVRERVAEDARGWWVVLTDLGYQRLRGASGTHLGGVHRHVTGVLSAEEASALAELLSRMTPSAHHSSAS